MPLYDFECSDGHVTTISRPMREAANPGPGCLYCGDATVRKYSAPLRAIVQLDVPGYVEKAYRGEEQVPGLSGGTAQVRAIVDSQMKTNRKGRQLNHDDAGRRQQSLQRRVGRGR